MSRGSLLTPLALVAALLLAAGVVLTSMTGNRSIALAAPIGLAGALVIMRRPFLGLWLIVLFAQLDAAANLLFRALPVSGAKFLTLVTLVGVAVASYKEPRSKRLGPDDPGLRLAALFAIVLLISFLFVEDRSLGLWSVRRLVSLLVLFYLVVRLVTNTSLVRGVLLAVIAATFISGSVVVADWLLGTHLLARAQAAVTSQWQGIERSSGGSDYNPTTAATLLLTGTACSLMLFLRTSRWRWLTGPTALAGTAGVILSYARSAGLVFAALILWMLFKYRKDRRLPLIVATAAVAFAMALPFIPATYWERQATLTDFSSDLSLRRRLGYNIIGVHILAEHPLIGVGPGNYQVHYMDHKFRWMPGRGVLPRQLHNMYLEVATETGVVGFLCFGGMLLLALRSLQRARKRGPTKELRDLAEAVHFAYVGLLAASLFVPNEYNKYVWIFTGLGIALGRIADRRTSEHKEIEA